MSLTATLRACLLPGIVFQSVIVGGGYATGRELVEFFMTVGPVGGLLGLATAALAISLVMSVAYEYARFTGTTDYRSFCRGLLGRAWVLYEVVYLLGVVLILSVLGAAAGEFAESVLGLPKLSGTVILALLIGVLTFRGSALISRVLALWSLLLYATYAALLYLVFRSFAEPIAEALREPAPLTGWWQAGIRYTGYNLSLPSVLFCMAYLSTRSQAFIAGLLTGPIAILPAVLFFVAMLAQWPAIMEQPVPALFLIDSLQVQGLQWLFLLMVFGTFVETGTGLLHAINERIDHQARESGRRLKPWMRPAIALSVLFVSVYVADAIGIVALIAEGYSLLSWALIAILILPLMTLGIFQLLRGEAQSPSSAEGST